MNPANRSEQAVSGVRNRTAHELLEPVSCGPVGSLNPLESGAIERWENEGGEIPESQIVQTLSARAWTSSRFIFA